MTVIAIAGLAIESSTFSPARTEAGAFHPSVGDAVFDRYPFLAEGTPLRRAVDWRGALVGRSLPGGIVTADAYASLADTMVDELRTIRDDTGIDGVWFDIHGAMTVEGLDDAEADLIRRVRDVVGNRVPISTSMDLHGNVSPALVHASDIITCYRMAPHEDAMETRERAAGNLVALLAQHSRLGGPGHVPGTAPVRPVRAWVPVPVLLPGEQTSTRVEPAASLYAEVARVADEPGVLDAAVWVGYAWADEPRNRATVVVTGDPAVPEDVATRAAAAGAERLARHFWDVRHEFRFVAPTDSLSGALDTALASTARPYFVSDSGDNPTAGGAGDMTWGLARILERPEFAADDGPVVLYASVPGPTAVATAVAAGVGATVTVTVGALIDDRHEGPLTITGVVDAIHHGDPHARTEVVIRVGSVRAIITELRKPYHHEHDFTDLGLDPRHADIVVVKIGYLEPELYDMAADWTLALTPGGVDQDLPRLGHSRILRPMFPFDDDPAPDDRAAGGNGDPDLHARIVPAPDAPLGDLGAPWAPGDLV